MLAIIYNTLYLFVYTKVLYIYKYIVIEFSVHSNVSMYVLYVHMLGNSPRFVKLRKISPENNNFFLDKNCRNLHMSIHIWILKDL